MFGVRQMSQSLLNDTQSDWYTGFYWAHTWTSPSDLQSYQKTVSWLNLALQALVSDKNLSKKSDGKDEWKELHLKGTPSEMGK